MLRSLLKLRHPGKRITYIASKEADASSKSIDRSVVIVSMKRFEYVHPAGGNEFTSVKLSPDELEMTTDFIGWCDVRKGWGGN